MRDIDFKFRVDPAEREMIRQLAHYLRRKEADAVRYVVLTVIQALNPAASVSTDKVQHAQEQ